MALPSSQRIAKYLSATIFAVLVLILAFSLAACTSDNAATPIAEESGAEAEPTSILEGIEIVETIPPTTERDEPKPLNSTGPLSGGVLAAPLTSCPIPDPAIDAALGAGLSINNVPLVTEIHAGLVKASDDVNSPIQLELADSYDVQENGLLYEFVLRQDLRFSDGTPLNASDVKWSWERALKKSITASRARDVFGSIAGANTVIAGESDDLSGVVVVDDRTLKVRLNEPRAEFIALLADPVASVLKRDNVLQWGVTWYGDGKLIMQTRFTEDTMPVGAGPFKLVDYWIWSEPMQPGRCAIARNTHYWGRPAYLDGVWFRPEVMHREVETAHGDGAFWIGTNPMAFVQEETDYEAISYLLDVSRTDHATGEMIEVDGAEILHYEQIPTISFFVLNPAAPPFDDIHFRRALAAGTNIDLIRWSDDKSRRLITEDLTTLDLEDIYLGYNAAIVEAEVAQSKYSEHDQRWEVGYLTSLGYGLAYDIEMIFDEWRDLLNIDVRDGYYDHAVLDEYDGRRNTDYHIRIFHEEPIYPDPSTVLRAITAPFGEINKAAEFVKLEEILTTAAVELDMVKRHEMYLEIESYLAQQALVIPIETFKSNQPYRVHSWVHDIKPPKYPGSMFYNVWLDERAPKRELPSQ